MMKTCNAASSIPIDILINASPYLLIFVNFDLFKKYYDVLWHTYYRCFDNACVEFMRTCTHYPTNITVIVIVPRCPPISSIMASYQQVLYFAHLAGLQRACVFVNLSRESIVRLVGCHSAASSTLYLPISVCRPRRGHVRVCVRACVCARVRVYVSHGEYCQ